MVVDKYADPVKEFKVGVMYNSVQYVIDSLRLMERMKNLEKVHLDFDWFNRFDENSDDERDFNETSKYRENADNAPSTVKFGNFAFPKLKVLELHTDISLPFAAFQSCKSIERVKLYMGRRIKKYKKLYKILTNNNSSLKYLEVVLGRKRMKDDRISSFLGKNLIFAF